MGQTWRRRDEDQSPQVEGQAGQRLWLESCVDCKLPLAIMAVTRPDEPRCAKCAAASDHE